MTREEASFILANIDRRVCDDELNDALDMAIKTLEQEPCDAKEIYNKGYTDGMKALAEHIELCKEEQEPKTGHWITKDGREQGYDVGGIKTWYIQIMCDKCGFIRTVIEGHAARYKFCPKCGAKMESEVKQ